MDRKWGVEFLLPQELGRKPKLRLARLHLLDRSVVYRYRRGVSTHYHSTLIQTITLWSGLILNAYWGEQQKTENIFHWVASEFSIKLFANYWILEVRKWFRKTTNSWRLSWVGLFSDCLWICRIPQSTKYNLVFVWYFTMEKIIPDIFSHRNCNFISKTNERNSGVEYQFPSYKLHFPLQTFSK